MTNALKPDWRSYEELIFEKFSEDFPDCRVLFDQKVVGSFSGASRQIDVLIEGSLAGHQIFAVVECKCFNKKIDIKEVDSFVGFLEDLNANIGIMITNIGYSQAARNRTFGTKIKLEIVSWDEFQDHEFSWDYCICEPEDDFELNLTDWWVDPFSKTVAVNEHFDIGLCKLCHSVNVKCKTCSETLYFPHRDGIESEACRCGISVTVEGRFSKRGAFDPKISFEGPETH